MPIPLAAPSKVGVVPARLLGLWVRIPPGAWVSVSRECYVLSCRGIYDGPITRPEESCRLWCIRVSTRYLTNKEA
jgi:hypothetical protein